MNDRTWTALRRGISGALGAEFALKMLLAVAPGLIGIRGRGQAAALVKVMMVLDLLTAAVWGFLAAAIC